MRRYLFRSPNISISSSSDILSPILVIRRFTSAARPVITCVPVFELPIETAAAMGHKVVTVPLLAKDYSFDVQRLAEESRKAGGGLIYLCNPNNPTSTLTPTAAIDWLAANLHPAAVLAVDEAYIHFDPRIESAVKHVAAGRRSACRATAKSWRSSGW